MFMDIASALDALIDSGLQPLDGSLTYFPVRSIGSFESKFNKELTDGDASVASILAKIDAIITDLIQRDIPVLVNSNEHTTVCVGFDADSYYFADSWGDSLEQDEFDTYDALVCSHKAGVSKVPKAFIVSFVRDMAWFVK